MNLMQATPLDRFRLLDKAKPREGWTKAKILAEVKKYNDGTPAYTDDCLYETPTGNRCAVGCFIPSEHEAITDNYQGDFQDLMRAFPDLQDKMPLMGYAMTRFQQYHDHHGGSINKPHMNLPQWIEENVL